jgi:hypothetical protein
MDESGHEEPSSRSRTASDGAHRATEGENQVPLETIMSGVRFSRVGSEAAREEASERERERRRRRERA